MTSAAVLVRHARARAGLSKNALAVRAGVTASTVARIEADEMDPTLTMLQRILAGADCRLTVTAVAPDDGPRLARLTTAWDGAAAASPSGAAKATSAMQATLGIDWTRLRSFVDWARKHTPQIGPAIEDPPARTGNQLLDNLLAGIAEKLADDAGLARPRWVHAVPGLSAPWIPPGTPRMVARVRRSAPSQLSARNIWISEADLWRADV